MLDRLCQGVEASCHRKLRSCLRATSKRCIVTTVAETHFHVVLLARHGGTDADSLISEPYNKRDSTQVHLSRLPGLVKARAHCGERERQ